MTINDEEAFEIYKKKILNEKLTKKELMNYTSYVSKSSLDYDLLFKAKLAEIQLTKGKKSV